MRVHLVAVNEVAKDAGVGICEVEGLVQDEVWVVAEIGVEGVVLKMRGVQVIACELIAAVLSDYAFEVVHRKEVRVVPAGGLEGHGEGGVEHLIVTLVKQGRSEVRLL